MNRMFADKIPGRLELPDGYSVCYNQSYSKWRVNYENDDNTTYYVGFTLDFIYPPDVTSKTPMRGTALNYGQYTEFIGFAEQAFRIAKQFIKEYRSIEEAFERL